MKDSFTKFTYPMTTPHSYNDFSISNNMLKEWQDIVDLIAKLARVRASLIMRRREEELEVFVASHTQDNPYIPGQKNRLNGSGLYCEHVIRTRKKLVVPNASKSEKWKHNPDMQLQMRCYMGLPIRLPSGEIFGTICILDDQERHFPEDIQLLLEKMRNLLEAYLRLWYQSMTDPLTGFYNRTYFNLRIEKECRLAQERRQPLTAMLLDMDHFKKVNDTLGHLSGDQVLRNFAHLLNLSLSQIGILFRFGGDEFYILLPKTEQSAALDKAEQTRLQISSSRICPQIPITTSIGLAQWIPGETIEQWFSRTDQALYQAKQRGGNCTCAASPTAV